MRIRKHQIILIVLLIVGAFLRFYNYGNRISLGWESARDYFVSDVASREKQLPLIGPWASIAPLTTGPWYWYYLAFSRFFIPSVYAPWMAMGLASLAVILIMYRIGVLLKDRKLGLILALIATFSPNLIDASVNLTNPSLIVFLTSLSLLSFLEVFKGKRKQFWAVLLGWLVGFTLLTHYQGAGLLTLLLLLFGLRKERIKTFFSSLKGLFISVLPMIIFGLNNHWYNTRAILDFIFHRQYQLWTSMRWLIFIFKFFPSIWSAFIGGPVWLGLVLMLASAVILFFDFLRKKLPLPLVLLVISFLIQVVIVRYWRGERYLGWVQFFSPYVFIFTGLVFEKILRKFKNNFYPAFLISSFLWLALIKNSFIDKLSYENKGLLQIRREIQELKEKRGKKFKFYYCLDKSNRDQKDSYLLVLSWQGMLEDDGFPVGFNSGYCHSPYSDKKKEDVSLTDNFLDFSQASPAGILKTGWKKETPRTIYDSYVKWWYQEKP